jgi:hypothetical protein
MIQEFLGFGILTGAGTGVTIATLGIVAALLAMADLWSGEGEGSARCRRRPPEVSTIS